jgi:NFU1 iron-sulfur cluster scaffold homolog, mitochondrial
MFIQTEPTPNPDALKFLPGRVVAEGAGMAFDDAASAQASPLAHALFGLHGVTGVFFGPDHVAVTRSPDGPEWSQLKPHVLTTIMDHFVSGVPLVRDGAGGADHAASDVDDEIVREIKHLLDSRVRPAVAQDGGDILFDAFDPETGVLTLRMRGACAGCPSSTATLKAGVEQMMRHYVPEVTSVEAAL